MNLTGSARGEGLTGRSIALNFFQDIFSNPKPFRVNLIPSEGLTGYVATMEDTGNDTPDECSLRNRNREPRSKPYAWGGANIGGAGRRIPRSPTRVGRWKRKPGKNMVSTTAPCPRREEGAVGGCSGMSSGASIRGTGIGGRPGVHPTTIRIGSGEAGRAPARVARASACYRGDPGKPFMPIDLRIFSFSEKGSFQRLIS